MRLFLAIEPSGEARSAITGVLARATEALGPAAKAVRWIPPENLHLTLQFLGEVDPVRLEPLAAALQPPAAIEPFPVSLDRFGLFPPAGPPRTIWLGVQNGAASVREVHAELGRRLASLRFDLETRPFTPHLTLGRVRDQHRGYGAAVRSTLTAIAVPPIAWRVTQASLFESDLSGPRPRYTERGRVQLGDKPGL
jgi:2'-5' RNA ligase